MHHLQEIVLEALSNKSEIYELCSKELQHDKDVILKAIKTDYSDNLEDTIKLCKINSRKEKINSIL